LLSSLNMTPRRTLARSVFFQQSKRAPMQNGVIKLNDTVDVAFEARAFGWQNLIGFAISRSQ